MQLNYKIEEYNKRKKLIQIHINITLQKHNTIVFALFLKNIKFKKNVENAIPHRDNV